MITDECAIDLNLSLEGRCVRCNAQRDPPEESTIVLMDSESNEQSIGVVCVVKCHEPCRCREHRVKVTATMGMSGSG
ncbi:MAG: hypothetical protein ABFD89_17620 [Bryobacteraceae bacterium]